MNRGRISQKGAVTIEFCIPEVTIRRLPAYLRLLSELEKEHAEIVSSRDMSIRTGYSSEQIRKDLAYFGAFGTRGVGYRVDLLKKRLRTILGLDEEVSVVLVGAGRLGQALARHVEVQHHNIRITRIFDVDEEIVGEIVAGVRVEHASQMGTSLKDQEIRLAVVAVPGGVAQEVVDALASAGVRAILNFAPEFIESPEGVAITSVDLSSEMRSLAYFARGSLE